MKTENLKFRQAIFENGKFVRWHYWGFIGYKNVFIGPITITGINIRYDIKNSQQNTGEKDFWKKNIYEGDKIINQSKNDKNPHPIIFYSGKFLADCGEFYYDFSQEIEENKIEVTGNIYE